MSSKLETSCLLRMLEMVLQQISTNLETSKKLANDVISINNSGVILLLLKNSLSVWSLSCMYLITSSYFYFLFFHFLFLFFYFYYFNIFLLLLFFIIFIIFIIFIFYYFFFYQNFSFSVWYWNFCVISKI